MFLFLAGIIAFSRIVVGVHFLSDVIGGVAVSYLGIKLAKLFLYKFQSIETIQEKKLLTKGKIFFSLVIFLLLIILLTVGPSIDIYLSSLFYYSNGQFLLQSFSNITIFFRKIILPLIIIYMFILPIISMFFPLKVIFFNHKFGFKDVIFLWTSSIFNLLIIVNLLLKTIGGDQDREILFHLAEKKIFLPGIKYQIHVTSIVRLCLGMLR